MANKTAITWIQELPLALEAGVLALWEQDTVTRNVYRRLTSPITIEGDTSFRRVKVLGS